MTWRADCPVPRRRLGRHPVRQAREPPGPTRSTTGARMNTACKGRLPDLRDVEVRPRTSRFAIRTRCGARRCPARRGPAAPRCRPGCVGQHDHPRAGAVYRQPCGNGILQRLGKAEQPRQFVHHAGLPAGDHQTGHPGQFFRSPHRPGIGAERFQHRDVLAEVSLQGEYADRPRVTSHVRRVGAGQEDRRR